MEAPGGLWIALTVWAAFAQTLRNTVQRSLTASLGTLGATLVRFLYGLPFALAWLACVHLWRAEPVPALGWAFLGWVTLGAVAQIAGTAFLLLAMEARSFALGVAYSKTELLQIAVFGLAFLGDPVTLPVALAVACGTLGVLLLSPADPRRPFAALLTGLTTRPALLGLASGAGFAFAAVGYRGAALALDGSFLMRAATALAAAQFIQTFLLGGWLLWKTPRVVADTLHLWRPSLFAGLMGAAASAGWFSAFALQPASHVRTLGLIELVFSYAVSRKLFRESLSWLELAGMAFLAAGIAVITLSG
ncbi:MAG: EamA/RhaT family transporter [Betaproteobacteria bacterium]|nr:EamA/RhaT family transporter [Betaproteobacteria bacterium]